MEHRRKVKNRLVDIFGGKCQLCGYNKCVRSLQFHHLNPDDKLFSLSKYDRIIAFGKVAEEAKKCILVCANCHGELESKITIISDSVLNDLEKIKDKLTFEQTQHLFKLSKKEVNCPICDNVTYKPNKYCSPQCAAESSRRVVRPNKDELAELLWQKPTSSLAKKFGVSDKAIQKWTEAYGLCKPPRGYWTKSYWTKRKIV